MTEAQAIKAQLFGNVPQAAPPASLTDYICDLFVKHLPESQLAERRKAGAYRNIKPAYLRGYYEMRGK